MASVKHIVLQAIRYEIRGVDENLLLSHKELNRYL